MSSKLFPWSASLLNISMIRSAASRLHSGSIDSEVSSDSSAAIRSFTEARSDAIASSSASSTASSPILSFPEVTPRSGANYRFKPQRAAETGYDNRLPSDSLVATHSLWTQQSPSTLAFCRRDRYGSDVHYRSRGIQEACAKDRSRSRRGGDRDIRAARYR